MWGVWTEEAKAIGILYEIEDAAIILDEPAANNPCRDESAVGRSRRVIGVADGFDRQRRWRSAR
jgi:hypothetical protein